MRLTDRIKGISWGVAYRKKGDSDYKVIKNPVWGWAADPFLYERGGETYIFAELWEYKKGRAGLGYICLSAEKPEWKVVIRENFHLSYPNIFEFGDELLICPESSNDRSLYFYRCVSFPDKWEKQEPFITGKDYSDTTFLTEDGIMYGFTCVWHEKPYKMEMFRITDGQVEYSPANPVYTGGALARPGGAIYSENGKYYRVCQDCSVYYGKTLVITEMELKWPSVEEKIIKKIEITDVTFDRKPKAIGIHTYNRSENYEVIDYKMKKFSLVNVFYRIVLKLKHR